MSISELLPQGGAVKPKVRLSEKALWGEYVNCKGKAYVYALITEYVKWVWTPLVHQKDMYRYIPHLHYPVLNPSLLVQPLKKKKLFPLSRLPSANCRTYL